MPTYTKKNGVWNWNVSDVDHQVKEWNAPHYNWLHTGVGQGFIQKEASLGIADHHPHIRWVITGKDSNLGMVTSQEIAVQCCAGLHHSALGQGTGFQPPQRLTGLGVRRRARGGRAGGGGGGGGGDSVGREDRVGLALISVYGYGRLWDEHDRVSQWQYRNRCRIGNHLYIIVKSIILVKPVYNTLLSKGKSATYTCIYTYIVKGAAYSQIIVT